MNAAEVAETRTGVAMGHLDPTKHVFGASFLLQKKTKLGFGSKMFKSFLFTVQHCYTLLTIFHIFLDFVAG